MNATAPISLALETNLNNFITKGSSLSALRHAYQNLGNVYLYGLCTGLGCFLRLQGHDKAEYLIAIELLIQKVTDGKADMATISALGG